METMKLKINPELRDLLPPLGPEELAGLEADIIRDGCTDPLTVWGEIIVDGHHRYTICTKHDIQFKITQKKFDSIVDVKIWMCQRQDNRRNLILYQRGVIALKMKPVLAEKAKLNQKQSKGHGKKGFPNLGNLKTQEELAKRFKVSKGTLSKIEFLETHADQETRQKLCSGLLTIDPEYKRLKAEIDAQKPPKPKKTRSTKSTSSSAETASTSTKSTETKTSEVKPTATAAPPPPKSEAKPETELPFKTGLYCRPGEKPGATGEPYVTSSSLTDLPHNQPEVLVAQLIAHFPREYARKCPFLILEALRANDGSETTIPLAKDIIEEFGER